MLTFRSEPILADVENIRHIIASSGFFQPHEIPVAIELVEERLHKGIESGYYFMFVDIDGRTIAYSCFGEIPCTKGSFDLYWIATHNDFRGKGIGKKLLLETVEEIKKLGGKSVYIETSSKPIYEPTRFFYEKNGCSLEAILKDFYDTNDHKYIYKLTT